eukprot:scaffold14419_cov31-Tisochrysis_lutea.AAC.3
MDAGRSPRANSSNENCQNLGVTRTFEVLNNPSLNGEKGEHWHKHDQDPFSEARKKRQLCYGR